MNRPVTIVDYGRGNLYSVARSVIAAGGDPIVTDSAADVARAERVILPGVGAFGDAMTRLRENGFTDALREFTDTGRPFLGICLGMQLLFDTSEEHGMHAGLGFLSGRVVRLPTDPATELPKVPSVGWARLRADRPEAWEKTILRTCTDRDYCYFVHSFHSVPSDRTQETAWYDFGGQKVTAVVTYGNVSGCQFHPEKSAEPGGRILSAWLKY